MDGKISSIKPPEVFEQMGAYHHRLELTIEGEKVGYVNFEYRNKPFPFYYISFGVLNLANRAKGWGKEAMLTINAFLDSHGKAGILMDAIPEDSPAHGMYAKYGWTPVAEKPDWYSYNLPKNLATTRVEEAIYKIDNA